MFVGSANKRKPTGDSRPDGSKSNQPQEAPEDYIQRSIESRDYTGAVTFIEFLRDELSQPYTKDVMHWHGYSLFHSARYTEAISLYEQMLKREPEDLVLWLYISSCHYYNQEFTEARDSALKGPTCDFRTRLLFHISHRLNDEQGLYQAHSELVGTLENQLSLAAIHYMRSHYQEAIEIYQRLLIQRPEFLALNVYIAMCQFKLEQYEESNEAVDLYLMENSDSAVALNVKSCDYLKLFDSAIAESQLLQIRKFSSSAYDFIESLITHNLCIFHDGEDGFTILPKLVNALPEARHNLAVLYMRNNNPTEANEVLQDYQPIELHELILRATVLLALGQLSSEASQIEEANSMFADLGVSDATKDTVPGRECLASTKFIIGEYDEALRVLQTIEELVSDVDEFNYDKGMTLASLSKWAEAERYLLMVKNPAYTKEKFYITWLCRCYIKNKKPMAAWNLYLDATSTEDSKVLLHIIAADCYASEQYYYAMRAYDVLSKYETDPSFRDGLVASAVGVYRGVLTRKESSERLRELISILAQEPEAKQVLDAIRQHALNSGELDDPGY